MSADTGYHYLQDIGHRLSSLKAQADRALAQVKDDKLYYSTDGVSNSVAVLMKHMAGNMIHNWTYPFAPDEEKPVRDREGEFEAGEDSKEAILRLWEEGWRVLLDAVAGFTDSWSTTPSTSARLSSWRSTSGGRSGSP